MQFPRYALLQRANYRPRRLSNAGEAEVKGALCRWEKEILALGSNTSPGRGSIHGVLCRGPQNLKLRYWFYSGITLAFVYVAGLYR